MKTMIHTIKEINERKDILPNHTLGYQIFDSCYSITKAMESALVFLTGQEEYQPNFRNSTGSILAGIVGSGGSSLSVAASRIFGLYYMPQVSRNIVLSACKEIEMGIREMAKRLRALAVLSVGLDPVPKTYMVVLNHLKPQFWGIGSPLLAFMGCWIHAVHIN